MLSFLFTYLLPLLIFSCFFVYFLLLWLSLVSSCISCLCGFILFICMYPAAVALHVFSLLYFRKIRIHPYPFIQGHYGLSAIYWVGLANLFCFLFSSFIHYIGPFAFAFAFAFLFFSFFFSFLFFFFLWEYIVTNLGSKIALMSRVKILFIVIIRGYNIGFFPITPPFGQGSLEIKHFI